MKADTIQNYLTAKGTSSALFILLSGLILTLTIVSNSTAQDFYDMEQVNTIEITFSEPNWNQILVSYYEAGNDERLLANAVINGVEYDSIGVRYKGNSSYNSVRGLKKPLNIKLDYIIEDQEINGYGTLKLSNGFKDPSFVRETLGYEIARKYGPASLANYANVYINDELIGLYTSVQSVDKNFLDTHFYYDDGALFKGDVVEGNPGPGQNRGEANLEYLGADSTQYYSSYEIKSDYGWTDLVHLCDTLNNYTESVESILDIDRALWQIAYHNVLLSLDSPINTPHNFYLYRNENRQFNYIFWDLNMTFGTFNQTGLGPEGRQLSLNELQQLDPYYNFQNASFPILDRLMDNELYRKIYIAHSKTILEENFANGWYETRAYELQDIVDEHVEADPNKFYTYQNFLQNVENQCNDAPGIVQLMDVRTNYLLNLGLFNDSPVINNIVTPDDEITPGSEIWINVEVENTDQVLIAWRNHFNEIFTKNQMFDDGQHNDESANDGIFGISILADHSDLEYYIQAENDNAITLSPPRAEYEYYILNVTEDIEDVDGLVINEFMASNDTTVADPDGEHSDWLEIYNNSENSISMSGVYLSDDNTNILRWAFPDTTIEAHSYLIVWVDDDENEPGIHASFNLAKSGEMVILAYQDGSVIDSLSYGEQYTDISLGRYPNGTGDFILMTPSFSQENYNGMLNTKEDNLNLPTTVYLHQNHPNPFNPSTTIQYDLNQEGNVKIVICNMLGEEIKTLVNSNNLAGRHSVIWNGRDYAGNLVGSGIYFCQLTTGRSQMTRKMILLK